MYAEGRKLALYAECRGAYRTTHNPELEDSNHPTGTNKIENEKNSKLECLSL